MAWETVVYRRKELYDKVWAAPTQTVAKEFGISDVGLAKICRRLDIPRPGRGYWAKKAAGVAVKTRPLLPPGKGVATEHRVSRWREPRTGNATEQPKKRARVVPIPVDVELTNPHPLVKMSIRQLRKSEDRWDALFRQEACLNVRASGEALDRGIRVMDALLKALCAQGHTVEVTEPRREALREPPRYGQPAERITPSMTGVHIGGFFIEFGIEELVDVVQLPPPRPSGKPGSPGYWVSNKPEYERIPNGKLALKIKGADRYNRRSTYADGKKQRIDLLLSRFVEALLSTAESRRLAEERRERERQERLEADRRREEEARRREMEQKRRADLQVRLSEWREARDIREFVDFIRSGAASQTLDSTRESDIRKWIEWARAHADRLEREAVSDIGSHQKPSKQTSEAARPFGQAFR